ncbi:hypothetical protein [Xanthomonas phage DES1]|nr:hypothetical protein [Xanthomonas phage DES1]
MATLDWNVKNAISRDVERQHLNKILADIRSTVDAISKQSPVSSGNSGDIYKIIEALVTGNTEQGISVDFDGAKKKLNFRVNTFTVNLTGDVTGSATSAGLSSITIQTTLNGEGFVREAPYDENVYWRGQGQWQAVPSSVLNFPSTVDPGFLATDVDGFWVSRTWQTASTARITITNTDGSLGNPVWDLATVPNSGLGALVGLQRDAWGRITGTRSVTTDDLSEGSTNLYFTQERAQDAAGLMFTDSVDIDFTYDDANGTVTGILTAAVKNAIADSLTYEELKATLVAGTNVTIVPNDTAKTLTLNSTASGGGSGTVTSVNASGGSTGLTFSGGPITTAGTLTLSGTLAISNGGTGATTSAAALINLGANLYVEKATTPTNTDYGRAPINGDEWWNTSNGTLYKRVDGAWVTAGGAGNTPSYKVPAILTTGVASNISLNADRTIQALLTNGTATTIPTVT